MVAYLALKGTKFIMKMCTKTTFGLYRYIQMWNFYLLKLIVEGIPKLFSKLEFYTTKLGWFNPLALEMDI